MSQPKLLFEDSHLVVLSKPAGLLSQGERTGDENLVDWLRAHFGRHYVGLIHRLDRNTSGLMVIGKRTKAARRLTEALQQGQLQRTYLALLSGSLEAPQRWEHWLVKDERTNTVRAVPRASPPPPGSKQAVLQATPLKTFALGQNGAPATLAGFRLETGRFHQIRAQAAAQGLPLLGDRKYGGPPVLARPALHSARLSFPHPISSEIMEFEDDPPEDMQAILVNLTRYVKCFK